MGRERYTTKQVIEAIRGTFGIKTAIAKTLGCHRVTIDRYIERHPTVAQAYWEERERIVDLAEGKFTQAIGSGEWPAIRFALATLGKDRGFVERKEIDQTGDTTIRLVWEDGNDKDLLAAAPRGAADGSDDTSQVQGSGGRQKMGQD